MNVSNIRHINLSIDLQQSISSDIANHFLIIPKEITDSTYTFFIDRIKNDELHIIEEELHLIFNTNIVLILTDSPIIKKALSILSYYHIDSLENYLMSTDIPLYFVLKSFGKKTALLGDL